jgi:simple sugar transport system ATP-binding protein
MAQGGGTAAGGQRSLPAASPPALEVLGMTKRFGPVMAIEGVSLTLRPGSFHALLGENGAGKSTLVKCVMGYHTPDDGALQVGHVVRPVRGPRDALVLGIGMVYQHFTLVPSMTVSENLTLARPDLGAVIAWSTERRRLRAFLEDTPFTVDLAAPVSTLAAGERQKVEILKQLYLRCRILLLDEPTSVLTPDEADEVLGLLRDMTRSGRLSVLLITHKLREVFAFADEVTVLRRGRVVGRGATGALSAENLASMMVGGETPAPAKRVAGTEGRVRLELRGLGVDNDRGHRAVSDVSLGVRAGEIVGIAGVSGNGQTELVEVLAGQRAPAAGTIAVHGEPYGATRSQMRRHQVFCLPEEPLRNACVPRMSVAENLAFRRFDEPPFTVARWGLSDRAMGESARDLIARYRIGTSSPDALVSTLSGGNVQRMVLARELSGAVEVLVAANPCFGLDIAATAEIRGQIVRVRNRGAAILLVSEDLDELFELADRIVVMFGGRVVYEAPVASADLSVVSRRMAGH